MPAAASATRSRTILIDDITDTDATRWADLADRAVEPNPFFHPDFLLTSRRWFSTLKGLQLVVVEKGDRWIAMLPLSVVRPLRAAPVRYASTAGPFLGKQAPVCAPLVDSQEVAEALNLLLLHLATRRSALPGLIELTLLPADGELHREIMATTRQRAIPVHERSRFARSYARVSGELSMDHLSGSHRKQLRRHSRSLAPSVNAPLEFRDVAADPDAVKELLALEAAGWKGRRGSATLNRPEKEAWFSEMVAAFTTRGQFRLLALKAGGKNLYMSAVLQAGDTCFGILDSYDETHGKHSPGQIGRLHELRHLIGVGNVSAFDTCMHPKHVAASKLYPDQTDRDSWSFPHLRALYPGTSVGQRGAQNLLSSLRIQANPGGDGAVVSGSARALIVRRRSVEEKRQTLKPFESVVSPGGLAARLASSSLATFCADTDDHVFALTYDDGPHPEHTPRILDVLARHNVRATFFVLMQPATDHPDIIHRIVAGGHELALHGPDHRSLIGRRAKQVLRGISIARERIEEISGTTVCMYRPPYGQHTAAQARAIHRTGLQFVVWSGDAGDWLHDSEAAIIARARAQVFPGAILLLHDDRADPEKIAPSETLPHFDRAAVTDGLLHETRNAGFRAVTAGELLARYPEVKSIALERRRA